MPRYFLELSFNGEKYNGWQIQSNATGVQQLVNEALAKLTGQDLQTTGCCRTDTGVHALQFFLHVDLNESVNDRQQFVFSLNGMLPADISVYDLYPVEKDAHARFDATLRTYRYYGYRNKNPFLKNYAGAFYFDLDTDVINACCRELLRYSDFSSFAKTGTDQEDFTCRVYAACWHYADGLHCFEITANRFLRGMVRALTGTLLLAGRGRLSVKDFCSIIENKDRKSAGISVAPQGLYLSHVEYPFLNITRHPWFPFQIDR